MDRKLGPFHGGGVECSALLVLPMGTELFGQTWHPVVVSNVLPNDFVHREVFVYGPLPVINVVYVIRLYQADPQVDEIHSLTFANQLDIVFILLRGDYGEFSVL